jgi:hypothetical protein
MANGDPNEPLDPDLDFPDGPGAGFDDESGARSVELLQELLHEDLTCYTCPPELVENKRLLHRLQANGLISADEQLALAQLVNMVHVFSGKVIFLGRREALLQACQKLNRDGVDLVAKTIASLVHYWCGGGDPAQGLPYDIPGPTVMHVVDYDWPATLVLTAALTGASNALPEQQNAATGAINEVARQLRACYKKKAQAFLSECVATTVQFLSTTIAGAHYIDRFLSCRDMTRVGPAGRPLTQFPQDNEGNPTLMDFFTSDELLVVLFSTVRRLLITEDDERTPIRALMERVRVQLDSNAPRDLYYAGASEWNRELCDSLQETDFVCRWNDKLLTVEDQQCQPLIWVSNGNAENEVVEVAFPDVGEEFQRHGLELQGGNILHFPETNPFDESNDARKRRSISFVDSVIAAIKGLRDRRDWQARINQYIRDWDQIDQPNLPPAVPQAGEQGVWWHCTNGYRVEAMLIRRDETELCLQDAHGHYLLFRFDMMNPPPPDVPQVPEAWV